MVAQASPATLPGVEPSAALDTFPKYLIRNAKLFAGRVAVREKDLGIWQTWTWSAVAQEVREIACGLASLGFKPFDNLAIVGANRPHLYMAVVAAQSLRGVPVPLYQDAVAGEMVFMLDDAGIEFVMAEDQEQVDKLLADPGIVRSRAKIEATIADLEDQLSRAMVIDPKTLSGDKVVFGATVTLIDEDEKKVKYQLVGALEADAKEGKISYNSPLGRALIGRQKGEEVEVTTPAGDRYYEVAKIEFI